MGGNPLSNVDPTGLMSPTMTLALGRAATAEVAGGGPENPVADVVAVGLFAGTLIYGAYELGHLQQSSALPPGYWPADSGAAEWGKRTGVGAKEGKNRFHRGVKDKCPGARGDHDFGVNPETGDVMDPNGESVGNLHDVDGG